jgi:chaperonin cofactor prefoldin
MSDYYPETTMAEAGVPQRRQLTTSQTLKAKRQRLQTQLADVEAAIVALEKCPEVDNILNLLSKAL